MENKKHYHALKAVLFQLSGERVCVSESLLENDTTLISKEMSTTYDIQKSLYFWH